MARDDNEEKAHVDPAEEAELLFEESFFEGHDEAHEADGVQHEADNSVVRCERE